MYISILISIVEQKLSHFTCYRYREKRVKQPRPEIFYYCRYHYYYCYEYYNNCCFYYFVIWKIENAIYFSRLGALPPYTGRCESHFTFRV